MKKKSIVPRIAVILMSTALCMALGTIGAEAQKNKSVTHQEIKRTTTPKLRLLKHHKSEGDVDLVALNKSGSVVAA